MVTIVHEIGHGYRNTECPWGHELHWREGSPIECSECPDFIERTWCGWRAEPAIRCKGTLPKHDWFITADKLAQDPHTFDLETLRNAKIATSREFRARLRDRENREDLARERTIPFYVEGYALYSLRIKDVAVQLKDLVFELFEAEHPVTERDFLGNLIAHTAPTPPEILAKTNDLHKGAAS